MVLNYWGSITDVLTSDGLMRVQMEILDNLGCTLYARLYTQHEHLAAE